jgi:hypothetical protein
MDPREDTFLWRFKWHIAIVCTTLLAVIILGVFTDVFLRSEAVRDLVWLLGALVLLGALLAMLSRVFKIVDTLKDNSTKLEEVTQALENIGAGLTQISQSTRISETAKSIAFRDAEKQSLRDAVSEKLKQNDFEGAYEIIDEIAHRSEYHELADELRTDVDEYRQSSLQQRIDQGIAHIESLFDSCQWAKASIEIETLITSYPESESARDMRQRLVDRKEERKKILLAAWDDAIQNQETDRSLEILRDLDMYLTPNEALALQEAAKDVFRTKLHNLGVQFSIAVTEKRWADALEVGQQIVSDFPNSKMAEEIRQKLDVLRQNVQMQSS